MCRAGANGRQKFPNRRSAWRIVVAGSSLEPTEGYEHANSFSLPAGVGEFPPGSRSHYFDPVHVGGAMPEPTGLGEFERPTDVGRVELRRSGRIRRGQAGSTALAAAARTSGGLSMRFSSSGRKSRATWSFPPRSTGRATERTRIARRGGWCGRTSSADSPYADAVVHGDGLISLQYPARALGADHGGQDTDQAAGVDQARTQRRSFHAFGCAAAEKLIARRAR